MTPQVNQSPENCTRLSLHVEKPALQNADTEWKAAWYTASAGGKRPHQAQARAAVPAHSATKVMARMSRISRFTSAVRS